MRVGWKSLIAAVGVFAVAGQAAAQPDAHAAPALRLSPQGLALVDVESGQEDSVGFGMSQDDVVEAISTALGSPEASGLDEDCDAGPLGHVAFQGDLHLFFRAGEFAGWRTGGGWPAANGLRVGMSYEDVTRVAREVEGEETSLGAEFAADGVQGLLTEASGEGTVTVLWAGMTCANR